VPVRVFNALVFLIALLVMFLMCGVNVICVSYVTPRMVGVLLRGSLVFDNVMLGCVFDSCRLSGVQRVIVDFLRGCGHSILCQPVF